MSLEQIWAGWRHEYVVSATDKERENQAAGKETPDCVFCRLAQSGTPSKENGIIWRGENTYVVLNAFPYGSGHLLVLPLRHVSDLSELETTEATELWKASRDAAFAINRAYEPDGLNLGANLGRAAGAGIPAHLHVHVLPRWMGDTNFMTSIGGVRVLPESLDVAFEKLRAAWPSTSLSSHLTAENK